MGLPPSLVRQRRAAEREEHAARVTRFLERTGRASMTELVDQFTARLGAAKDVHNLVAWMLRHGRIEYQPGPSGSAGAYQLRRAEPEAEAS
jgi:hypothetical protein